jgi:IS5 family transposase
LGRALGSKIVEQIHQRLVEIVCQRQVVDGRKMRLDTTVTEVNIHYPTDSSLLGDGTRVLTRIMKQISELVGEQGTRLRDRLRTIGHRVMEIARISRGKGQEQKKKMEEKYRELVRLSRQVRNQAQRFSEEIQSGVKRVVNQKQQSGTAGDETGVGCDDSAGQPGAATNHCASFSGCHRHARQDRQRVRTHGGNHRRYS